MMNDTTLAPLTKTLSSLLNESVPTRTHSKGGEDNHVLLFILLPVTALLCVAVGIGMIVWLLKRSRMDKLRHHLMPMYNFDPSDSGGDWETDLLSQEVRLRRDSASPPQSPVLKLSTMHSEL
ncbi:uncharacterized protein C3orf18 homolog [Aplysia californica]|uniref:Uncharacterized protein C3orf18 homolog n=1 Tax=Aplysia californica TaxID=6500 RepID=A0ABM0JS74_APLCA|nr:uncharacterized protein C3orf18 homolog [Aplysia californica]